MRTLRYAGRRLLQAIPIILGILIINFLILQLAPGDVVDVLAGEAGAATAEYMAELRERFGLDRPVPVQLFHYLLNAVQLDLGYSFRHGMPVVKLIASHIPPTLLLMATSTLLAVGLGIVLGVVAARFVNRPPDTIISILSLVCYATPLFWIGLMMIVFFSVELRLLPSGGFQTLGVRMSGMERIVDIAWHTIQPAVALSLFYLALYTRLTRASMLEVYGQDYVRTAFAKGLNARRVAFKHVLWNAILPTVTMAGIQVSALLGGAVLVETVFAWPGIGRLAYEAVHQRDFNLLLGILFMTSAMVILINLLVDILYAWLDPRIEMR